MKKLCWLIFFSLIASLPLSGWSLAPPKCSDNDNYITHRNSVKNICELSSSVGSHVGKAYKELAGEDSDLDKARKESDLARRTLGDQLYLKNNGIVGKDEDGRSIIKINSQCDEECRSKIAPVVTADAANQMGTSMANRYKKTISSCNEAIVIFQSQCSQFSESVNELVEEAKQEMANHELRIKENENLATDSITQKEQLQGGFPSENLIEQAQGVYDNTGSWKDDLVERPGQTVDTLVKDFVTPGVVEATSEFKQGNYLGAAIYMVPFGGKYIGRALKLRGGRALAGDVSIEITKDHLVSNYTEKSAAAIDDPAVRQYNERKEAVFDPSYEAEEEDIVAEILQN